MTLELTISQNQTAISESCNNVAEIQANIQFLNIIKGKKGDKGDTPYIGLNGNWWVSGEDTGTPATGDAGVGISNCELVSTVGKVKTYRITFSNSTTFEYTLEDGSDGREVLIQNNGTYIQWQYEGDVSWNNIIEVSTLKGDTGESIELQVNATHIQWRVVGDLTWINLISLEDLKGDKGDTGAGVPIGGTTSQKLVKKSNTDYDTEWTDDLGEANIIEEVQANGTPLTVTNKSVNVVIPTQASDIGAEPANSNIQQHISDETIHHTIEELDELYESKNSNIQEHIADTDIHVTTTDKSNWDAKADLDEVLKLDQTTPQTIQGNVNVNGNVNAVTTNVNQSTLPSVNASQNAAILQDGSAFTGTDYVMPTNNVAVKFVASAAHTMGDFTVRVKSSATLTSTTAILTGYLYSDNAGSPSTLLATGNSIRHGSITTSYQELSLGTQYNLVAGTTYWLVIRWSSAPTGGNIIFDSNTDTNVGATSANATSWTLTNVRLRYRLRGRTFYGINAFSTNSYGVYGASTNNIGVYGISTNSYGVYGASTNNIGVFGISTNSYGVYGASTNYYGVYGESTNSYGVYGNSTNYYGVYGYSTNNRAGYFRRNTATPTSAVPVVEIIQDHASDTNSVLDVKQDGTGEIARFFDSGVEVASVEKGGLGIYKKGVVIGDNTDAASYENRGATRYRENAGGSFYEMVMKKQDGSYAWVSLVSFQ